MTAKNILIVGLGGQGINSLYNILQATILQAGHYCKGAIFKGGAQKRGSIYAMIRIFEDESIGIHLSPIIPDGELDLLIAFEGNEAMRYSKFYNPKTRMIVNDYEFPFYNERFSPTNTTNTLDKLKLHLPNLTVNDYNKISLSKFGNTKMVNILMGLEAIDTKTLPVEPLDFLDAFQQKKSIQYEDMLKLMEPYSESE